MLFKIFRNVRDVPAAGYLLPKTQDGAHAFVNHTASVQRHCIYGDVKEDAGLWHAHPYVATLVTLGTPHFSKYERWTRKNLDFANSNYPGAFHPQVRYVCVAGKAIQGARRPGQWLAHNSYQLTCGQANAWGDGITPVEAAHLEGAENLLLEAVRHSPRAAGVWYGSPEVLPLWVKYLQ